MYVDIVFYHIVHRRLYAHCHLIFLRGDPNASHASCASLSGSTVFDFCGSLYDTNVVYKVTDHFYVNAALSWHGGGTEIPFMIYEITDHVHRFTSGRSMRTSSWT